jgi:hypothetical protein
MGCEFAQGFFFSKPVVAEIALQFLRDQPFTALLHGGTVGPVVPTVNPAESAEDTSATSVMPPITLTDEQLAEAEEEAETESEGPPDAPARRPKRTG